MTPIEKRVLAYLDQHGPTHRGQVVSDLSSPESRAGQGICNGSNGAAPLIMGKWCAALIKQGFVMQQRARGGHYQNHAITGAGRLALRRIWLLEKPDQAPGFQELPSMEIGND